VAETSKERIFENTIDWNSKIMKDFLENQSDNSLELSFSRLGFIELLLAAAREVSNYE